MDSPTIDAIPSLSLTAGGPGDAIFRRLHLTYPEMGKGAVRVALILLGVSWVPLLALSLIQGVALGGSKIPFLYDISVHVRFILAVPILILAEVPIGRRLRETTRHFVSAGLVSESDSPRFEQIVVDTVRFRDSNVASLVVLAIAYIVTFTNFAENPLFSDSTWSKPVVDSGLTWAGYWYLFVALPILQFLLFRWGYRMLVWSRFLIGVSRLDLRLSPAHPDGAAGLGFLGKGSIPFGVVLFATSAVLSSSIAVRILFHGAKLEDYQITFPVLFIIALIIFTGPLLIFAPRLLKLKQDALLAYGDFASQYAHLFDRKWIQKIDCANEPLLGSGDIQSLADLGNSYKSVHDMRAVPVELSDFIAIVLPGVIPALPLIATVMPVGEIFKALFKLIA